MHLHRSSVNDQAAILVQIGGTLTMPAFSASAAYGAVVGRANALRGLNKKGDRLQNQTKAVLIKQENEQSALRGPPEAELRDQAQGKASVHGNIGLHGFIAPAAIVRSVRVLAQGNPVVDDAAAG